MVFFNIIFFLKLLLVTWSSEHVILGLCGLQVVDLESAGVEQSGILFVLT